MASKKVGGSKRPMSEISFSIPTGLLQEFGKETRIVLKPFPPGLVWLDIKMISKLRPELIEQIGKSYDVVLMPKAGRGF